MGSEIIRIVAVLSAALLVASEANASEDCSPLPEVVAVVRQQVVQAKERCDTKRQGAEAALRRAQEQWKEGKLPVAKLKQLESTWWRAELLCSWLIDLNSFQVSTPKTIRKDLTDFHASVCEGAPIDKEFSCRLDEELKKSGEKSAQKTEQHLRSCFGESLYQRLAAGNVEIGDSIYMVMVALGSPNHETKTVSTTGNVTSLEYSKVSVILRDDKVVSIRRVIR